MNIEIENTSKFNKKISKFYKTGNIQRAIELCQSALLKDPTNADLHVKLGDLYLEWHLDIYQARSYIDEAITEYQRALETYINSPEVYHKIGLAFFHKHEIDKAINYFEMAIEKNSKYYLSYYMLAECYSRKSKFNEALEYAKKSLNHSGIRNAKAHFLLFHLFKITRKPSFKTFLLQANAAFFFLLKLPFDKNARKMISEGMSYVKFIPTLAQGLLVLNQSGPEKAIKIYQRAVDKAPGFMFLYWCLGKIYHLSGRYDDAITEYKMALWLDNLDITTYRSLCQCYEEIGDYDSAIEIYRKLIEIQPDLGEYHGNLANILYVKGEIEEAVSHYQNAIILSNNKEWASATAQILGYIFQEAAKNIDAAISIYQAAYYLTPNDMDIFINLGSAYYDKADYDNALNIYRKALELQPKNAKIHCNLAYLYWGKGNIDEAIKEYEISIKYDKYYDIAYNNLGVIYLDDLGRVTQAIELFKKAINCNPNYALAQYNLARAVSITGDKVEAAKLYQNAMNINNLTNEIDPQDIVDKISGLFE